MYSWTSQNKQPKSRLGAEKRLRTFREREQACYHSNKVFPLGYFCSIRGPYPRESFRDNQSEASGANPEAYGIGGSCFNLMLGGALGPGHKAVLLFLGKISSEGEDLSVSLLLSRQHMSSRIHRSGGGSERERSMFSWANKGPFHKTKHPLGSREGIRL